MVGTTQMTYILTRLVVKRALERLRGDLQNIEDAHRSVAVPVQRELGNAPAVLISALDEFEGQLGGCTCAVDLDNLLVGVQRWIGEAIEEEQHRVAWRVIQVVTAAGK